MLGGVAMNLKIPDKSKTPSKKYCRNCREELTKREIKYGWQYRNTWFCGNGCATSWSVKKHLELMEREKK